MYKSLFRVIIAWKKRFIIGNAIINLAMKGTGLFKDGGDHMKKLGLAAVSLILVLTAAACSQGNSHEEHKNHTALAETQPKR